MDGNLFHEPVTVYFKQRNGVLRPTQVLTPREAFEALTTGEPVAFEKAEWHLAFQAVTAALLDPTPQKVEASRSALQRLANVAGLETEPRRTVH
jgi:hypothetical protein